MKKYNISIKILAFLLIWLSACSEDILDKTPLDRYSSATVWTDINLADAYLKTAYRNLSHGFARNGAINSVSDETHYQFISGSDIYLGGNISADNVGIFGASNSRFATIKWSLFNNVKILNTFLANIDKVADAYPEIQRAAIKTRADIMKGEALFLRAYTYGQLALVYGGLPIINKEWKAGDDYLALPRGTWKETVDFIVADCDAAVALLKSKSVMESGRATNAAALSLKSRVLLFAASDLTADGTAESKYVGYESPNRTALWTAARDAAKAVIDLNQYQLANFGAPDQDAVATNYFNFFKQTTLTDKELIWGKMFVADVGDRHTWNQQQGPNGINNYGSDSPTQALVDAFQMKDGSNFFDHYTVDANGYYKNKGTTKYRHESPYYDREPRFYASVLADSSVWQKRFADLAGRDPLGIYDRRTRREIKGGVEVKKTYGIDTRNGPVENWNATYTGYLAKKMMDDKVIGKTSYNTNIWIVYRYAEILMNYAEACLELGDIATATTYINIIRNRAGLPDFTGDIETALRHERQIEFTYEALRWYDVRRWKTMETLLTNAKGMDIIEVKDLDTGITTTTWQLINVQNRKFVKKMYWIPIETTELKKAPQLVQNPGY